MTKVLIDIHHEELFESLRILFEDRLGFSVYRPVGTNWWKEGYWRLSEHLSIEKQKSAAMQFLSVSPSGPVFRQLKPDERLAGDCLRYDTEAGSFLRYINVANTGVVNSNCINSPVYTGTVYKGVTLDTFKEARFDILVCTVPEHIDPYLKLISLYQPHAKLIFQAGNPWLPPTSKVKNILTSTTSAITDKVNCVYYHQEFNLNLFSKLNANKVDVKSMFNLQHFMDFPMEFAYLSKALGTDWSCKAYGAGNSDGVPLPEINRIADLFKKRGFCYHNKLLGDGYGYNIHHATATGTPLVLNTKYFAGQTAAPLLVDGVTCIDMDNKSLEEVVLLMKEWTEDYENKSNLCYEHFHKIVDFDKEFIEIQKFIDNLL